MNATINVECTVHIDRHGKGARKVLADGPATIALAPGRVPRVARLLALAHRCDGLIRSGAVADYAELARLGHVSRARMSQIMNLLLLAPDIQEAVLHLPAVVAGRDPVVLRDLQPVALEPDWRKQRRLLKSVFPH